MTRLAKIVLGIACAFLLCAAAGTALGPRAVRAYSRRCLHWHPDTLGARRSTDRANHLPPIILWAWERPEDLRFLTPGRAGVAFLAKTIYLQAPRPGLLESSPASFVVRPRLQPLRVAPGTPLVAVVRIETTVGTRTEAVSLENESPARHVANSTTQQERLASEIADLQNLPGVASIQIDFDAATSEHSFYSALLQDVRRKLSPSTPFSITALASWCMGDPWLTRLPPGTIDEAVPMLFRMGPDTASVVNFLRSGNDFPVAACQGSLGLSTDEPLSRDLLGRKLPGEPSAWHKKRIYVFAPRAWSQPAAGKILQEWQP